MTWNLLQTGQSSSAWSCDLPVCQGSSVPLSPTSVGGVSVSEGLPEPPSWPLTQPPHWTAARKEWIHKWEREREMFYLTMHSTHFIYGYMASDIWLRTILIVRKETRCRHIGYSYRLTARVLLYAPSHRQDNIYHSLCYTSRGALVGTRNSSMGPPHEGSIRWPIAPWANTLPLSYVPLPT